MLFNSYEFILIFLPLVLLATWIMRFFGRIPALLSLVIASFSFYGLWEADYIALLVLSIFFNYMIGNAVYSTHNKSLLAIGVAANLCLLAYYKYRLFFGAMVGLPAEGSLLIPLGISFYTFHQISFLIDVHRNNVSPRGFAEYLLYVTFFPQLIAGPIVRFTEVISQFKNNRAFKLTYSNTAVGLTMLAAGLFKKQVIADSISLYATPMFQLAETSTPVTFIEAWTGVLAYTFQIYFDFSGYSDMALGLARIFGIRLPVNFNSPYKATSIIDFWRRWHISLSRFLRDYLYVALGGKRRGKGRRHINVLVVMLLGGLWHGAAWTFVLWGGLHGIMLIINHAWRDVVGTRWRIPSWLCWCLTMMGVMLAWTLFRAESLHAVWNIWQGLIGIDGRLVLPTSYQASLGSLTPLVEMIGFQWVTTEIVARSFPTSGGWLLACFVICLGLPNTQAWLRRYRPACGLVYGDLDARSALGATGLTLQWRPTLVWAGLTTAMLVVAVYHFGNTSEFIYWQF